MHEDLLVLLKNYNNKSNKLYESFEDLKSQYDKTQYELRCIKKLLSEVCLIVAPHKRELVENMLHKHDKVYKTLHDEHGNQPIATIRFSHQLSPDLGSKYVWNFLS
nr:ORF31 [Darna trima granulovirus]